MHLIILGGESICVCRVCAGIKLGCNDPEQCSASDLKKNYKLLVDLSINSISFMIQFDPLCVSNNSFTEKNFHYSLLQAVFIW